MLSSVLKKLNDSAPVATFEISLKVTTLELNGIEKSIELTVFEETTDTGTSTVFPDTTAFERLKITFSEADLNKLLGLAVATLPLTSPTIIAL